MYYLGADSQLLFLFINKSLKSKVTKNISVFKLSHCIKRQPTLKHVVPRGYTVLLGVQGKGECLISLVRHLLSFSYLVLQNRQPNVLLELFGREVWD